MIKNKRSFATSFMVGLFLLLSSVTFSFANVPAPPVNQKIGIPDTSFSNLTKLNCAYCHAPEKLSAEEIAQMGWVFDRPEMKPGILADRHHLRVDTIMQDGTQAPFGTAGDPYQCLSCHKLEWSEATMNYQLSDNFKDCQNCHISNDKATVHHLTSQAQSLNCKHCHGARIDNPNDGHYVPLGRTPSAFTPRTSGGKGPNGQGACTFCHDAGVDTASGVSVNSNAVNHHGTGIGQVGVSDLDCTLCHDRAGSDWAIRRCENCHGISSIHNIQADSNGDGIIQPGKELPYFGHIGSDPQDCKGCHNNLGLAQNNLGAPGMGPIIPQITDMSTFKIVAGEATALTVSGIALTNEIEGRTLKSIITVTLGDNLVAELTPSTISQSSLVVTIPSSLTPGNYYIRAKKGSKDSNPMNLVVIPNVTISGVSVNNNALTVQGSGFGAHMGGADSNTKISVAGTQCSVESWNDSQIVAKCSSQCGEVTVETVFGSVTYAVDCQGGGNNDDYQTGYQAAYDAAFAEGNGDNCSGKTWNIDADLKYDTKYDQGYTDGYVYAYDTGWESSCGNGGGNNNDGSYEDGVNAAQEAGFAEGKSDSCGNKTWNIGVELTYDTPYNDGYAFGYVKAYDEGWESCR
jgi:hypothetical protein